MSPARPKRDYIRSKALLEAAREIPCQRCGRSDGTVCAAHSNQGEHGKGRGLKADDNRIASLCFDCHTWIDQSGDPHAEAEWTNAHYKTVTC